MIEPSATLEIGRRKSELKSKAMAMLPEGGNLDLCFTCGTCTSGCPASGLFGMDPRKFLRMVLLGMDEEVMQSPWIWICTMCQRCISACPMKIDIPRLVFYARTQVPRDERPDGILQSCNKHIESKGGAMGIPKEDFVYVVEDVLEETQEEQPEFADMQAPIDKEGSLIMLNQNSREPVLEPEEMVPLWKILHTVGADWTYSSHFWGGENYCMFLADDQNWEAIIREQVRMADEVLGVKYYVNTECGHSFYAIWEALRKYNIPHKFEFKHIVELYAEWMKAGKLQVSSDWNKELGIKFTCQDPCQATRKSLGDYFAQCQRYVIKQCVGEENFVDMVPNSVDNYCCGGGGGTLQTNYTKERLAYGKTKFDQIAETGANYCVTPCHNCHSQIHELQDHYEGKYKTIHLWTLVCLAMGKLGPNERTYLGPDLEEVNLPASTNEGE